MSDFMKQCVEVYLKCAQKDASSLHRVDTPFLDESLDWDCVTTLADEPCCGALADDCSKVVMKVLYGARMARPDVLRACTALGSDVS